MNITESRLLRAKILTKIAQNPYVIFREDPLIDYFTDDQRCDAVIVDGGNIELLGSREIDNSYVESYMNAKCSTISYRNRTCGLDDGSIIDSFHIPFEEEVNLIIKENLELSEVIFNDLRSGSINLNEIELSKELAASVTREGYRVSRYPVVAYDENSNDIWHLPGNKKIDELAYIEVIAYKHGISHIFSETVFLREGDKAKQYMEFLRAKEFLRENFIAGNSTDMINDKLISLKHEKLYLTQPLYPFTNWIMLPGNSGYIGIRSTAVFDLWIRDEGYSLRKKFTAISGYENAIIL